MTARRTRWEVVLVALVFITLMRAVTAAPAARWRARDRAPAAPWAEGR